MTRRRVLGWSAAAAAGGFASGYNMAVVSGALLPLRRDLGLDSFQQGALVGVLPLGAMLGGLVAGRIADRIGRRWTLVAVAALFLAATATASLAPGFGVLLASRVVAGLAVGAASFVVPLYVSELAPPDLRGRLVSLNQLLLTLGVLTAYCVDLAFVDSGRWHAMFAVGLVPAAVLLGAMLRAPEPAWRVPELRGLRGRELVRAARPALAVGLVLAAIQQLSGINAVVAYAPSIMQTSGLSAAGSLRYAVVLGAVNVAATVVSLPLVDRLGRRPLLLGSLAGTCAALVLLGLTFQLGLGSRLSLACLVAFVVAFALGLGPVFWLLIAEIFPQAGRAAGASVSAAANWFWSFVVGFGFLPVAGAIGQPATFWIFAGACLLGLLFVARFVPETKGRDLQEIEVELRRAAA